MSVKIFHKSQEIPNLSGGKNQWQKRRVFNQSCGFHFETCQQVSTCNYFWGLCLEILNLMGKKSPLSKGWALAEAWRAQTFSRARSYLHDQNVRIFMSILVQQNAVLQYIARDQAKLGSPFCGIQLVQVNHLLLVSCCSQEQLQRSHCHCLGEWTVNGQSCRKK